jgi:DNA-binding NarL/FixJ family response regulator
LVAAAFIPNPQELPWVNHINGRKDDNRASNLEWCDRQGNVRHAVDHGLMASQAGASNGNAKFSDRERRVIYRLSEIGFSQKAIAEMFESPQGTVQKVIAAGNCC